MKRVYKVILLFATIFLIGIFSFSSYINASLHKDDNSIKQDIRAVEIKQDSLRNAATDSYYLN